MIEGGDERQDLHERYCFCLFEESTTALLLSVALLASTTRASDPAYFVLEESFLLQEPALLHTIERMPMYEGSGATMSAEPRAQGYFPKWENVVRSIIMLV